MKKEIQIFSRLDFLIFFILSFVLLGLMTINVKFAMSGFMFLGGIGAFYYLVRMAVKKQMNIVTLGILTICGFALVFLGYVNYPQGVLQKNVAEVGSLDVAPLTERKTEIENYEIPCGSMEECKRLFYWAMDKEFSSLWQETTCYKSRCFVDSVQILKQGVADVKS